MINGQVALNCFPAEARMVSYSGKINQWLLSMIFETKQTCTS